MSTDEEELKRYAAKAVEYDKALRYPAAIHFYREAASKMLDLIKEGKLGRPLMTQVEIYVDRAEQLKKINENACDELKKPKSEQQINLERAEFLLYQALTEDDDGNDDEAITLYTEAIQLCLANAKDTPNEVLRRKLRTLAAQALDRVEALKSKPKKITSLPKPPPDKPILPKFDRLYVGDGNDLNLIRRAPAPPTDMPDLSDDPPGTSSSSPRMPRAISPSPISPKMAGASGYTPAELKVIRTTSVINNREYVPFMSVDLKEKFAYPSFSDKNGLPPLDKKQLSRLRRWVRPSEYLENPKIIVKIDSGTIKQTLVSDCSFVASLAVSAQYENKTGKQLITRIIYPQNKAGQPVYNPCGKYMVKLHLNGVPRKVIIDDRLPQGHNGELLCSHSQIRSELWVSLLEKAYIKVMGGYDFPGSNSNIDLHALTGWIPERISIRKNDDTFNGDAVFEKLFDRFHRGDCLITVATGKISDAEADRAGLVECHAYAMLDVRKFKNKRLMMIKNPWTHLRWKGRFSERDLTSWTPEMRKALDYNPEDAQQFDDGIFWIDYESVLHFYDVFYVNWNPALFPHTYCFHELVGYSTWTSGAGPVKDLYSIADNPQYSLKVNGSGAVWVHLTRHITDKTDFADNQEFIAVLVYKTGGNKVYYPFDPKPFIDGTRINSPHYLCQMNVFEPTPYTLVVAQYEKLNTIHYTIRVYASCPFTVNKIVDQYKHSKTETGGWTEQSAGGCGNYRDTHNNNPLYQFSVDEQADVCLQLKAPKQFSVGFTVVQVNNKGGAFEKKTSEPYRPGYCVLPIPTLPAGVYNVMPTTFLPKQIGPFFLTLQSTVPFKMSKIRG